MASVADFIKCALSYKGTKFIHQGRVPHVGLDCVGLLVCAAQEAGYNVTSPTTYKRTPRPDVILEQLAVYAEPAENDGTPGLIHVMRAQNSVKICHLCLRLSPTVVLESCVDGSVSENMYKGDLVHSTWALKGGQ